MESTKGVGGRAKMQEDGEENAKKAEERGSAKHESAKYKRASAKASAKDEPRVAPL